MVQNSGAMIFSQVVFWPEEHATVVFAWSGYMLCNVGVMFTHFKSFNGQVDFVYSLHNRDIYFSITSKACDLLCKQNE